MDECSGFSRTLVRIAVFRCICAIDAKVPFLPNIIEFSHRTSKLVPDIVK